MITLLYSVASFKGALREGRMRASLAIFFLFSSAATAEPVDITKAGKFDIRVDGHIFASEADSYWRENYNAHSYYVVVASFADQGGLRRLIPIVDKNMKFQDVMVDAPGSDCFRSKMVVLQGNDLTYIIRLQNNYSDETSTAATLFKAQYNELEVPGFPLLYFEEEKQINIPKVCDDSRVDFTAVFRNIR